MCGGAPKLAIHKHRDAGNTPLGEAKPPGKEGVGGGQGKLVNWPRRGGVARAAMVSGVCVGTTGNTVRILEADLRSGGTPCGIPLVLRGT